MRTVEIDGEAVAWDMLGRLLTLAEKDVPAAAGELCRLLATQGVDFHTVAEHLAFERFATQFEAAAVEIAEDEAELANLDLFTEDDGGPL